MGALFRRLFCCLAAWTLAKPPHSSNQKRTTQDYAKNWIMTGMWFDGPKSNWNLGKLVEHLDKDFMGNWSWPRWHICWATVLGNTLGRVPWLQMARHKLNAGCSDVIELNRLECKNKLRWPGSFWGVSLGIHLGPLHNPRLCKKLDADWYVV